MLDAFLAAAVALATPILLAALGELLVERAGVLNIGLEGMMLVGAFAAAAAAASSGSPLAGVAAAAVAGLAIALVFALVAVTLAADQIIAGAAVNLIALGGTGALYRVLYGDTGAALVLPTLPRVAIPGLSSLPVVGDALFRQHALVYVSLVLVPVLSVVLAHTGLGLRLRALGEHPLAAASLGLRVRGMRVAAIGASGVLAGLGGAALALWTAGTFVEGVTAGRGFVALAVVVFARWSPWGTLAGALLFGLANALQFQFQASAVGVPYQLFLMLPYVVTLAALLLPAGTTRAPRALGARYDRE
ncbi:MAG TPA: ABC transporter permease [Candidatus Binatia bacterium]|nr:ABC transporter permease [Candidatus Binatia bacterium]